MILSLNIHVVNICRRRKKCNDRINRIEKENFRKRENFRAILGFKEHEIIKPIEQTLLESLRDTFEGENIQSHYIVLEYEIDLYLHDYKLAVEFGEKNHEDRNIGREMERQKALEKELGCQSIRINSNKESFNILKL